MIVDRFQTSHPKPSTKRWDSRGNFLLPSTTLQIPRLLSWTRISLSTHTYPQYQFKSLNDPCLNSVESAIQEIRQNTESTSKSRVLFHYNGHGVLTPSSLGEIWLFNRNYDKYKPVSILSIHVLPVFSSFHGIDLAEVPGALRHGLLSRRDAAGSLPRALRGLHGGGNEQHSLPGRLRLPPVPPLTGRFGGVSPGARGFPGGSVHDVSDGPDPRQHPLVSAPPEVPAVLARAKQPQRREHRGGLRVSARRRAGKRGNVE